MYEYKIRYVNVSYVWGGESGFRSMTGWKGKCELQYAKQHPLKFRPQFCLEKHQATLTTVPPSCGQCSHYRISGSMGYRTTDVVRAKTRFHHKTSQLMITCKKSIIQTIDFERGMTERHHFHDKTMRHKYTQISFYSDGQK